MTDPIPFPMFYHFHPVTPRRQAFWLCLNLVWTNTFGPRPEIATSSSTHFASPRPLNLWSCEVALCSGSLPGYLRALRVRPQTTVAIVGGVTFTVWGRSNNNTQQQCLNIGDKASGVGFTIKSFTLRRLGGDTLAVLLPTLQTDVTIRIITQCRNVTASALWNINHKLFYSFFSFSFFKYIFVFNRRQVLYPDHPH